MSQAIRYVQYDLFGEIEAVEQSEASMAEAASAAAVAFLTETPWPGLLGWWVHSEAIESQLDHGSTKASYRRGPDDSPGWSWATWRDGLRFESDETWPGWGERPRWCIAWSELHAFRNGRSDVTERLQVLAAGRGHPCSLGWRWWTDPHALRPDGWHPSCLESEKLADAYHGCSRPESAYADRLEAWHLVLDAARTANLAVVDTRPDVRNHS